jgi:competence protein ComFC
MKYKPNLVLGRALALQMVDFIGSLHEEIDLLISVPLGKKPLRERGYNQVALAAQPPARHMGLRCLSLAMCKARETCPRIGLSMRQRENHVQNSNQADARNVAWKSNLLMDDFSITRCTISPCLEALFANVTREVYGIAMARASAPHDLNRVLQPSVWMADNQFRRFYDTQN